METVSVESMHNFYVCSSHLSVFVGIMFVVRCVRHQRFNIVPTEIYSNEIYAITALGKLSKHQQYDVVLFEKSVPNVILGEAAVCTLN